MQTINSNFLTFINTYQKYNNNNLKLFTSLLISLSYSNTYTNLTKTKKININNNNKNYLTTQFKKLSQHNIKKYLKKIKHLTNKKKINFNNYLNKISHLINKKKLTPNILNKIQNTTPKLINFTKSFNPNSKKKIKKYTNTSKLIYNLFKIKSKK